MGRSKEEKILFWRSKTSLEVIGEDDAKGEKGFHNSIQNEASLYHFSFQMLKFQT